MCTGPILQIYLPDGCFLLSPFVGFELCKGGSITTIFDNFGEIF